MTTYSIPKLPPGLPLSPLKESDLAPLPKIFSTDETEYLRTHPRTFYELCRRNAAIFVGYMFRIMPGRLHFELHRFFDNESNCGVCLPRGHGKTVNNAGRIAWELGHDHNLRIPVVQNTSDESQKTVRLVKQLIEDDRIRAIFPSLLPNKNNWGAESLTVLRSAYHRDPSVTAANILGKAGFRADILSFDDIEDLENSIRQPAMRASVEESYTNTWLPTLVPGGKIRRSFTPWHIAGIGWQWVQNAQAKAGFPVLYRPVSDDYVSPWPEMWTRAELRRREQEFGSGAYTRAFKLRPISGDETIFRDTDLLIASAKQPPNVLRNPKRVTAIDLAFSEDEIGVTRGRRNSDASVQLIADLDEDGHAWMKRCLHVRCSWPTFQGHLVNEWATWKPDLVIAESAGPQKGFAQEISRMCSERGIAFKALSRGKTTKITRAMAVQAVVEQHRLHLPSDPSGGILKEFRPIYDELVAMPLGEHDDLADAAIDIMSELQLPQSPDAVDRRGGGSSLRDIIAAIEEREERERRTTDDPSRLDEGGWDGYI